MRLPFAVTALFLALLGCTGDTSTTARSEAPKVSDQEPDEIVEQPTATIASTSLDVRADTPDDCTDHASDLLVRDDIDRIVPVALFCEHDGKFQLVDRVVSRGTDQLMAIVEQLFLGATPDEVAAGFYSSFSAYTAGQFGEVHVGADGVVVIDLGPGFITANNFSTSSMSAQVFDQIAETMFTVPEVAGVEFTFDGQRWCGWEAGPCESVPRPMIPRR